MRTLYLGDIHGQFWLMEIYIQFLLNQYGPVDKIVQVGDFGYYPDMLGEHKRFVLSGRIFRGYRPQHHLPSKTAYAKQMVFIRGNHELHSALFRDFDADAQGYQPSPSLYGPWEYARDGLIQDGVLYLGGAWSIDGYAREQEELASDLPSLDPWQKDLEQISSERADLILEEVQRRKDEIHTLVTHDCAFKHLGMLVQNTVFSTPTGRLIDQVLDIITPQYHFFGHHHKAKIIRSPQTTHILLDMVRQEESLPQTPNKGWFYIVET